MSRTRRRTGQKSKKEPSLSKLKRGSKRLLATGAVASSLILTPGIVSGPASALPAPEVAEVPLLDHFALRKKIKEELEKILPKKVDSLDLEQEKKISDLIWENLKIRATCGLEGNRLDVSYGIIGGEQHLKRYPGDTLRDHDEFRESGIAPSLGAWGYFANSQSELTFDLVQKEKYYVAVQTLYLKDWAIRQPELKEWYKFRKVIVINPETGQSVIAVIADAGPSWWTGKIFGGSPEVMHHLGLGKGKRQGPVILFFVDDPENKVSLGPIG
jgi:hypothetical protein